jgi:hypothetical protein
MVEPSGDEMVRMESIVCRIEPTELDYLMAMIQLPDGVGRLTVALQTQLDLSEVFRNRGRSHLTPLERRRRERLFVLLGDVVKLPRKEDVAAAGNRMLDRKLYFARFDWLSRRQVMYRYWMELLRLPADEQGPRINRLAEELCERPAERPAAPADF